MFVIRVRHGEDSWKYLVGVERAVLSITSTPSKAMVFDSRVDALIMCGFIENYFITLETNAEVYALHISEEIDFCCDLEEMYFEV